jgi:hypothetical protein
MRRAIKGKVALCLTNYALHYEGVWGSVYVDPRFLNFGTSWSVGYLTVEYVYMKHWCKKTIRWRCIRFRGNYIMIYKIAFWTFVVASCRNDKIDWINHHCKKTCGEVEVQLQVFLTSALNECGWTASCPRHFTTGERVPGTHCTGSCGRGLSAGLVAAKKRHVSYHFQGIEPWTYDHPVHSPVTIPTEPSQLKYYACRGVNVATYLRD